MAFVGAARLAQRRLGLSASAALLLGASIATASAQWMPGETYGSAPAGWPFGSDWFGRTPERRTAAPRRSVRSLAYAPPQSAPRTRVVPPAIAAQASPPQPGAAFCVRLCDGRFFPLTPSAAEVTPSKQCSALCPSSRTKVFEGASIEDAAAADGARYAKLATAFLFRKELVANCTCNGKNAFGLAKIDIAADPTLRAGDVVATAQGMKVFNGAPGARHKAAHFTPIKKSALVSADLRRTLRRLRVAKR